MIFKNKKLLIPAAIVFIASLIAAIILNPIANPPDGWTSIGTLGIEKKLEAMVNNLPKPYIVQSGSMEPAIKTGSLVFSLPSSSYQQGDIITFRPKGRSQDTVTHRIVFKLYPEGIDSEPTYITAGDANEDVDNSRVTNEQIIGKTSLTLPYLGHLADYAKTPQGFILFVIVPATIIIYEELRLLKRETFKRLSRYFNRLNKRFLNKDNGNKPASIEERGLPKASILLPVFGAFLVMTALSASYFLDIENSLGNILGAASNFENGNGEPNGPTLEQGNPSCTDLNYTFGFKIEGDDMEEKSYTLTSTDGELIGGAPEDPDNSITLSNFTSDEGEIRTFDWQATLGMDAVIVKGGPDANHYIYDPESFADTGLHAPTNEANDKFFGVSHVEFCYDYDVFVNELLPNPSGDEAQNEWIELYNSSPNPQDLSNWTINDTSGSTDTFSLTGKTIPANSFLVIERPESGITLNNGGDGIELKFSNTLIDSINHTSDPGQDNSVGRETDGGEPVKVCEISTKGTTNNGSC